VLPQFREVGTIARVRPPTNPLIAVFAALALLAAACSSDAEPTTTTAPPPTTTLAPATTTTTTTAAPTTTAGPAQYLVADEMPPQLAKTLTGLYSWWVDDRNPKPTNVAKGLLTVVESTEPPAEPAQQAYAVVNALETGERVAVAHVDDDVWFAIDSGNGWKLAGVDLAAADPWLGEEPRFLFVIGSDARVGENQERLRADSLHIVSLVPSAGEGAIVGFPRDSYIDGAIITAANETTGLPAGDLPGGGIKWTSLMAGRGPAIMRDTARELTGIPLEGYIVTGFEGYDNLIETLGSLVIDLPSTMRSGNTWPDFPAGLQTLTPKRALELARIRKGLSGGDFTRSLNQGRIMLAAMDMIQDLGIDALPQLFEALTNETFTDMSMEDLYTFSAGAFLFEPDTLVNMVIPGAPGRVGPSSVVFISDDAEDVYRDLDDGLLDETDG